MPTVAAPSLAAQHHDARAASGAFLLDAGELCCSNAFMPGLSDLGASLQLKGAATMLQHSGLAGHGQAMREPDSLLLGSLPYSDEELSAGGTHASGSAAMQFLLLDDDEGPQPCSTAAGDTSSAAAAGALAQQHGMLRQQSAHSCPAAPSMVPMVDSSSLYCLAVVDEETGLPLRPATPEETWEVERCFVLQEQSELLSVVLPQEQAATLAVTQHQHLQVQQQQQQEPAMQHQGALMDGMHGHGASHAAEQAEAVATLSAPATTSAAAARSSSVEPQSSEDGEDEDAQEQAREEQRRAEQAAKRKGPNPPPNRRPDQPRRCGPCDNCGATESPQWRQGPPAKPLLCNACGMRFRRTNQLVAGETGASGNRAGARANKKVPAPASVAVEEVEEQLQQQQQQRSKAAKATAPPMVAPDAKRPRRAAAVAAAASFAAAAIDVV